MRDALTAAQRAVTETAHDVRDQVGGAIGSATSAIGSIRASAQNAAQGAAGYAGGALSHSGQAAGQMGSNIIAALAESPVLLGALGLAAGALLGALIPRSDQEEAVLGGIAKQARDTATSLASQGLESGKHVAQAVADKTHESAQEHGLVAAKRLASLSMQPLAESWPATPRKSSRRLLAGDEAVRKEAYQAGSQLAGGSSAQPSPPGL